MKYLFFLLGLLFLLSVISCHKNTPQVTPFTTSDFPIKVGNKWVYQVNYYLDNYIDTQTVTIINKQPLSNDSVLYTTQVSFNHISGTWTQYLLTIGDTIVYNPVNEGATPFNYTLLKCPISPGNKWKDIGPRDTLQGTELLPSYQLSTRESFKNVYYLKKSVRYLAGYSNVETILLSPGIGIVQYNMDIIDSANGVQSNTNSTLISYQLQ